ncbi:16S rRNA (cytosine(1402)-N(4))-methyltransferase RsmH [Pleionea mediterranea]|jgi:16S rRNA (cytosine1402-N4)-methyltransferase|uniref:Ribosomal RNA small subunit methyltransferase H n=1 Tax=Pleionea mediterranea TaxID=523701 RepID=A0A316FI56_9GAMM|nr:16S rRNA (cytosine(1402)-N(4))-methyltransferase RsmH [Pleionea mediterranea]PWK47943.1 16S rRNA (cytosine1402-N4)-methyltransferase [Pleionea mediterranea]
MMKTQKLHDSVLLQEAVDALDLGDDSIIIDGTFGRGGHSRIVLDQLSSKGRLIGFDKDPQAVAYAKEHFADDQRFEMVYDSFANIQPVMEQKLLSGKVTGVLLDLGVSSPQLDQAERGFSFMKDGPLDMRMDPEKGQSAAQWLAKAEERDIKYVLKVYGEEKFATRIARKIVEIRDEQPLTTTLQLARLIDDAVPKKDPGKHPATRSFQAIRIHINEELSDLEQGLKGAFEILAKGGKLVVISFHSLEDRIVKRYFKKLAKGDDFPKDLPVLASDIKPAAKIIGKPVKPAEQEVGTNVRSRSAIMRILEKV